MKRILCVLFFIAIYSTAFAADHLSVRLSMMQFKSNVVGQNQLLLLGDSNTEQFFWTSMNGKLILNAGVGGIGIDEAINVANYILPVSNPEKVFVTVGVNDCIQSAAYDPAQWGIKLRQLLDIIHTNGAIPIVGSILPVEYNPSLPLGINYFDNDCIQALNSQWWIIVNERNEQFLNLNYSFADPSSGYQYMNPGWSVDGVHLNRAANIQLYYEIKAAFE